MAKFLEQIADYYTRRYGAKMAGLTFLFPNQRSCLFFKQYLLRRVPSALEMPEITTLAYFIAKQSGLREGTRNELLFTLYNAYKAALAHHRPDAEPRDYDRFLFWGSMMKDDFDEIDYALADPARIFSNIVNVREIAADFLTDNQKAAIREIWGETDFTREIQDFWYHVHYEDGAQVRTVRNFVSMWELMYDIYLNYRKSLQEQGIGSRGLQVELGLENLRNNPDKNRRYSIIGFSNVSNAERKLFTMLKDRQAADFFWDFNSPIFDPEGQYVVSNRALHLISKLRQKYPEPNDFEYQPYDFPKEINVVGLPSKVDQAKQAASLIDQWIRTNQTSAVDALNTAVVLPDASVLQPFLLGLPECIQSVNVTMEVPFNQSGFATFMRVATRLQSKARERRGRLHYFYEDVLAVLSNPHLNIFAQSQAIAIRKQIEADHLYELDALDLCDNYPELAFIFRPLRKINSAEDSYQYVDGLISGLRLHLSNVINNPDVADASFEIHMLDGFQAKLSEIHTLLERYHIEIRETTYLQMFEHLLRAEPMPMTGTPLKGLQAMGVLETRCLDFDNIIFLSMNERTYPRRHYVRTLIPNSLRLGYGLAPIEQAESFYGYYFYRAISNAKNVSIFYDARIGFSGSGEMSRYLNQMMYLKHDFVQINHITKMGSYTQLKKRRLQVQKTPHVMKQLQPFTSQEQPRYLSASSIKTYLKCPLQFYFKSVAKVEEVEELKNYVDEARMGTIYHNTMEKLFAPYIGKRVDRTVYERLCCDANEPIIREIVEEQVAQVGFGFKERLSDLSQATEEYIILTSNITTQVIWSLRAEKDTYCSDPQDYFIYLGGEQTVAGSWPITPDLSINFKMIIDRIDLLPNGNIRLIDYKTGGDEIEIKGNYENVFKNHKLHGVFQLMLYAEAYHDMVKQDAHTFNLSLHVVKKILCLGKVLPITAKSGVPLGNWNVPNSTFRPMLNDVLIKIFDSTQPFTQSPQDDVCRYCVYRQVCLREPRDYPKN